MLKLRLDEIAGFRESVDWLDYSSQAIFDCFDDKEFRQQLGVCIARCKQLADKFGMAEITVKG